jgi:hypothetical protein
VLSALLAASFVLTGCSLVHHDDAEARPLTVVLFDVSRSTRDPDIRARYLAAFGQVVDAAASAHGTVVGDVIDDNPLAHSTYPIDGTFAACDPLTDNKLMCDAAARDTRDQMASSAEQILSETQKVPGTDIQDAVALAQRVFDAYPGASQGSLVLLSDMVEHTKRVSVGGMGFGEEAATSTLDRLATHHAIPDLTGVRVYVVGAGVVDSSELPAARILAIERFWLGFFAQAHADLTADRYGAALVRFP